MTISRHHCPCRALVRWRVDLRRLLCPAAMTYIAVRIGPSSASFRLVQVRKVVLVSGATPQ
ncbi:hypothetical protein D7044_30540 [Micromonospora musae]|uniref:Uncharacterized protein n=1 Tax=Micromonospora musae TaxID=1894970 RepID=A0A3A9XXB5_9ACTN|nr:hypothetical protein D7044_30540 [Micromonospora musae]